MSQQNPAESVAPAQAPVLEKLPHSSFVIITILLGAAFVTNLNETILGVALPQIMSDLNIQPSTGQWLNTAFLLTMATIIPTMGWLQLRFSTRRLYIWATAIFSVGTLIGGLAPTFEILLTARILQASGTAVMFPLMITTMMVLVPNNLRGRVMGNIGIVMSVAPALGPAVSGLILNFFGWRWLFWLILPIAVFACVAGGRKIVSLGDHAKAKLDVFSVILSAVAFAGLIYGLSSFAEAARGTVQFSPWIPTMIGAAVMVYFVLRQLRLAKEGKAFLDLTIFKVKSYAVSLGLMAIAMVYLFGIGILVPIYVQQSLGMTPLETGFILLPGGLAMGLLSPVIGRLFDKVGSRKLLIPSSFGVSAAIWYMTTFDASTTFVQVLIANSILMISLGFMFTPLFSVSMMRVPMHQYSHGSSITGATQQVFGAAGTALFVTILTIQGLAPTKAGADVQESVAAGVHSAFLVGALLSLIAIAMSFWLDDSKKLIADAMADGNAAPTADGAAVAGH